MSSKSKLDFKQLKADKKAKQLQTYQDAIKDVAPEDHWKVINSLYPDPNAMPKVVRDVVPGKQFQILQETIFTSMYKKMFDLMESNDLYEPPFPLNFTLEQFKRDSKTYRNGIISILDGIRRLSNTEHKHCYFTLCDDDDVITQTATFYIYPDGSFMSPDNETAFNAFLIASFKGQGTLSISCCPFNNEVQRNTIKAFLDDKIDTIASNDYAIAFLGNGSYVSFNEDAYDHEDDNNDGEDYSLNDNTPQFFDFVPETAYPVDARHLVKNFPEDKIKEYAPAIDGLLNEIKSLKKDCDIPLSIFDKRTGQGHTGHFFLLANGNFVNGRSDEVFFRHQMMTALANSASLVVRAFSAENFLEQQAELHANHEDCSSLDTSCTLYGARIENWMIQYTPAELLKWSYEHDARTGEYIGEMDKTEYGEWTSMRKVVDLNTYKLTKVPKP